MTAAKFEMENNNNNNGRYVLTVGARGYLFMRAKLKRSTSKKEMKRTCTRSLSLARFRSGNSLNRTIQFYLCVFVAAVAVVRQRRRRVLHILAGLRQRAALKKNCESNTAKGKNGRAVVMYSTSNRLI